jgi:hypothetical protein
MLNFVIFWHFSFYITFIHSAFSNERNEVNFYLYLQGTPKGQLALLASNGSLSVKSKSVKSIKSVDKKNLRERLIQQLVSDLIFSIIIIFKEQTYNLEPTFANFKTRPVRFKNS